MHSLIRESLQADFYQNVAVVAQRPALETAVRALGAQLSIVGEGAR